MLMPIVLISVYKKIYKAPPQGSVVLEAARVFQYCFKDGGAKRMLKGGDAFWERAKPSYIAAHTGQPLDTSVVSF